MLQRQAHGRVKGSRGGLSYPETLGDSGERGVCRSQVTFVVFLCLDSHGGQPSIVIQPLGPVGLIVDVVGHFF